MVSFFLENFKRTEEAFKLIIPGAYGFDNVHCSNNKEEAIAFANEVKSVLDSKFSCTHESGSMYAYLKPNSMFSMISNESTVPITHSGVKVYSVIPDKGVTLVDHHEILVYEAKFVRCETVTEV